MAKSKKKKKKTTINNNKNQKKKNSYNAYRIGALILVIAIIVSVVAMYAFI